MDKSYYQRPSALGEPILDLLDIDTSFDCITAIEWAEALQGFKFSECQAVKYLWRLGVKTQNIQSDCIKILDYIERAIANESPIAKTLEKVRIEVIRLQLANDL